LAIPLIYFFKSAQFSCRMVDAQILGFSEEPYLISTSKNEYPSASMIKPPVLSEIAQPRTQFMDRKNCQRRISVDF